MFNELEVHGAPAYRCQRRRGRDPPIFDLQRSSCVDDPPQIFWQVFYFFPSVELLNTASRCHCHLQCARCTVFNSTHPECTISHHFEMKNSQIFWAGAQPLPRPHPLTACGASILASSAVDLRPRPQCSRARWRPCSPATTHARIFCTLYSACSYWHIRDVICGVCLVVADCWCCVQHQQRHSWLDVARMGKQHRRFEIRTHIATSSHHSCCHLYSDQERTFISTYANIFFSARINIWNSLPNSVVD